MIDTRDTSTHQQVFELLPWFVNETLADEERAAVQRHFKDCLVCRRELEAQRNLRDMFDDSEIVPLAPQQGLSALMARIDSQDSPGASRVARLWPPHSYWPVAAAVTAILLGGLVAISLGGRDERHEPLFRTLSENAVVVEDDAPLLQVIFADDVPAADVKTLVLGLGGRVIAGPSDTAAYTVEVDPAEMGRSLEAFRSHPGVRFAEHARVLSERE